MHQQVALRAVTSGPASTGSERLDELLGGGLAPGAALLVHGPAFAGKRALADLFLLASLAAGRAVVAYSGDRPAARHQARLARLAPDAPLQRVVWVDTISRRVGWEPLRQSEALETNETGPLEAAFRRAAARAEDLAPELAFSLGSLSPLLAGRGAVSILPLLQCVLGDAAMRGAPLLFSLEAGAHAESDVALLAHLADVRVELRQDEDRHHLAAHGPGVRRPGHWVDYQHTEECFDVTGSFSSTRIR